MLNPENGWSGSFEPVCQFGTVGEKVWEKSPKIKLGGGFKYFFISPLFGEDSHFDYIIFFKGVETTHQFCIFTGPDF